MNQTNWTGTRPALLRKGSTVVSGTRMGPYGGISVGRDSIRKMGLPERIPGFFNDFRPPVYAELPDSVWNGLGWTITDAN